MLKEEKKHIKTFETLKERVKQKGVKDIFVNREVDDYLDAVVRSGLFEIAKQAVPESTEPYTMDDVYLRANQVGLFAVERFGCMC